MNRVMLRSIYGLCLGMAMLSTGAVYGKPLLAQPNVQTFIDTQVSEQAFDRKWLRSLFAGITLNDKVLSRMRRPAENTMTWPRYRKLFLQNKRIQNGVRFWQANKHWLQLAEQRYGVPAEVVLAIMAVETRYGRVMGKDRVFTALATLAFGYPKRAAFFQRELGHFLQLAREQGWQVMDIKGSYAGAMGMGQFMPSSYRSYAVDLDGDGQRDLFHSRADAIGSIANYLARHGWKKGEPVASTAGKVIHGPRIQALLDAGNKPAASATKLRRAGVHAAVQQEPAALLGLPLAKGLDFWLGYNNFYAITRYNHSNLYAMAVYELSQAIARKYHDS